MKERFEGNNRPQLISALRQQDLVRDDAHLAELLASKGTLVEFSKGEDLIHQFAHDDDVFLLVMGVVGIIINDADIASRKAGQHVGEMAAIESSLPRSATVRARETVVALKISSLDFQEIGDKFPKIWIPLAKELARRLHKRNETILVPNPAPRLFIISSSEASHVGHAIRDHLDKDIFTKIWTDGVFFAGGYTLEALEKELTEADFAVAVAEADDLTKSRGKLNPTVRDNVVFELGLFMGKLTRHRAILVHPKVNNLTLPSDLQGLTVIRYEQGDKTTVQARIAPVCDQIRTLVSRAGVRKFSFEGDR